MIKKPVVPRLIGLVGLYGGVFIVLVMIQFTKQNRFEEQVGNLLVSGQYFRAESGESLGSGGIGTRAGERLLANGAVVSFGGLDFSMSGNNKAESLLLISSGGGRSPVTPESMTISGETVHFHLPGGNELLFFTQYAGGAPGLRISGKFAQGTAGISLSYKPRRSSRVRVEEDGRFIVMANGLEFTLNRSVQGKLAAGTVSRGSPPEEPGRLLLRAGGDVISYRAIPEKRAFTPADFSIPAARSAQAYNEAIIRWRDQNFSLWNRTIPTQDDEDMVIAYEGEAARRGNYGAAISAVSPAFRNGRQRTYESSVYLGGMERAAPSFSAAEREKAGRISRQIIEKSPDFLRESHVFEFFAIREYTNYINNGLALVHSIDPADLTLELIPGILEGVIDLRRYRPNGDNPFERLVDQSCFVISQGIQRMPGTAGTEAADLILVFQEDRADIEFNLRLGKALLAWAEAAGDEDWIGLSRSLILSCLSLEDSLGTVPAALILKEAGEIAEEGDSPRSNSARLYRILQPGEYYPQARVIVSALNGLWAWTAAPMVSAAQEDDVLDIAVTFPVGAAHYLMIRGVRPFSRIQIHGTDWRTDPQFERYDSSGWIYQAQDQTLILKLRHRTAVEHVRIFYREAAGNDGEVPAGPPGETGSE